MVAQQSVGHADNVIFSKADSQHWSAWGFALFWNAMVWFAIVMGGENILQAFEDNPIFYFFVTFPFIGLWLIVHAFQESRSWYQFKQTPITLNPFPAQVGGQIAGSLTLPLAKADAEQAIFSLVCLRRYYQPNSENSWEESPLWHDQITIRPESYGEQSRLRFSFNPPIDLPASEPESKDYHVWRLQVRVPLRGYDFNRSFELPLVAGNEGTIVSEGRYKIETPYIMDRQETVGGEVPIISSSAIGTQFYYGHGRSKAMGISLMAVGIFIAVFAYFFFKDFLDFLPITTGLMAISVMGASCALFLFGLFLIANSITVEVGLMGMHKQQKVFNFKFPKIIPAEEIVDLVIEQNGSTTIGDNIQVSYKIDALTREGEAIQVADELAGHRHAESIREQMLAALGMTWQPATLLPQDNLTEKEDKPQAIWLQALQKLLSYSFLIAIIIDITKSSSKILDFITKVFT